MIFSKLIFILDNNSATPSIETELIILYLQYIIMSMTIPINYSLGSKTLLIQTFLSIMFSS